MNVNADSDGGRVGQLIAEYLEAEQSGAAPEREAWLARHPEEEAALREFFARHDRLRQVGAPLRELAGAQVRYVGDYEVLGEIARGGMGVVYRARQVSLNREVALKMILSGQLASSQDVARFRQEAEAAANLDHPNVVPIFEVGEHEGRPYFSMKLIEGGSLAQQPPARTRDQRRQAALLLAKVARAVHHAHQRGILHRDLKPSNVLLSPLSPGGRGVGGEGDFEPHVSDFGLAKRMQSDAGLSQSGSVVGTPGYLSPEQARAEKTLTVAADVYGLGAVLYERLTGRAPFVADAPVDVLVQVVQKEPEPPRRLQPSVDRDLETICLKCLSKEPHRRYASAEALAEDLERWLNGAPIHARPVRAWERAAKWARRRPAVAALVGLVVLIAAAGAAGVAASYAQTVGALERAARGEKDAKDQAETAARREREASDEREKARNQAVLAGQREQEVRRLLVRSRSLAQTMQLSRAAALCETDPVLARRLLHDYRVCPLDAQDEAWRLHDRWCSRWDQGALDCKSRAVREASISPDGKTLAVVDETTLRLWDLATRKVREVSLEGQKYTSARYSPDGKALAVWLEGVDQFEAASPEILLLDPATGKRLASLRPKGAHSKDPNVRSDQGVRGVSFCPDGKSLAVAYADRRPSHFAPENFGVSVWDLANHKEVASFTGEKGRKHLWYVHGLSMSPDGKRLATVSSAGYTDPAPLHLSDLTGQSQKVLDERLSRHSSPVCFSPDGKLLASVSGEADGVLLWDVDSGRVARNLARSGIDVQHLSFSPDGRLLCAAHSAGACLWDVSTGAVRHLLRGGEVRDRPCRSASFSPDCRTLAVVDENGRVQLWDLSARQESLVLPGDRRDFHGVTFEEPRPARTRGPELVVGFGGQRFFGPQDFADARFSPDGKTLATAGNDVPIKLWDLATMQVIRTLDESENAWFCCLDYSPDGKLIAGAVRGTVRLWDAGTGKTLANLDGHTSGVSSVRFSPDGKTLASGAGEWFRAGSRQVGLWDVPTGKRLALFELESPDPVDVQFTPDGKFVLLLGEREAIDVATAKKVPPPIPEELQSRFVWDVCYAQGGKRIAFRGQRIHLWDPASRMETATIDRAAAMLVFSPDGKTLFGWDGNSVCLWDTLTGLEKATLSMPPGEKVSFVRMHPQGHLLLAGTVVTTPRYRCGAARMLRFWDLRPPRCKAVLQVPRFIEDRAEINGATFSPDGKLLAARTRAFAEKPPSLVVWDVQTGAVLATTRDERMKDYRLCFSANGSQVVFAAKEGRAFVYDLRSGKGSLTDVVPALATTSTVSPDGRFRAEIDGEVVRLLENPSPLLLPRPRPGAPDPDWHEREAFACEKAGQWFAAAYHWRRLADLYPTNPNLRLREAQDWVNAGQKERGALAFVQAALVRQRTAPCELFP
jgi:WD40 repeat protein